MIAAREKGKQPKQASGMFLAVQLQGVVPDVILHNALISTCEKGHRSK